MNKLYYLKTNHSFLVTKVERSDIPTVLEHTDGFTDFYRAEFQTGRVFWIAKGSSDARNQHVVWYPNGKFWSSYGKTIQQALQGASDDAYLYI